MSFRVCTYNVRGFWSKEAGKEGTVGAIVNAFSSMDPFPAVMCLNEVNTNNYPESLDFLAKEFGNIAGGEPFIVHFFGHVEGVFGNAILLNPQIAKLQNVVEHLLPGGSSIFVKKGMMHITGNPFTEDKEHVMVRGLLEAEVELTLEGSTKVLKFYCTHLDHMDEKERRTQAGFIVENLLGGKDGAILLGDLNSMKRSDYSKEQWKVIEERNKKNNWKPPSFGVVTYLERNQTNKWTDCFAVGVLGREENFGQKTLEGVPAEEKFTAHVNNRIYRIDYIMANEKLMSSFRVSGCFLFENCVASDHIPVVCDFEAL